MRMPNSVGLLIVLSVVAALALGPAAGASQVTLTADDELTQGADLGTAGTSPPDISPTSGDGSRGSPWLYEFNPAHVPTPGGLDMAGYKVYTQNNPDLEEPSGKWYGKTIYRSDSIKLDLGGWSISGAGTTGIQTYWSSGLRKHPGTVTIANADGVEMGGIDTHSDSGTNWAERRCRYALLVTCERFLERKRGAGSSQPGATRELLIAES